MVRRSARDAPVQPGPQWLIAELRALPSRLMRESVRAVTCYDLGRRRGRADARAVLGLEGRSDYMRHTPEALPGTVPMTATDRAEWLLGYAAGITAIAVRARDAVRKGSSA